MSKVPYCPRTGLFYGINLRQFGLGVGNDSTNIEFVILEIKRDLQVWQIFLMGNRIIYIIQQIYSNLIYFVCFIMQFDQPAMDDEQPQCSICRQCHNISKQTFVITYKGIIELAKDSSSNSQLQLQLINKCKKLFLFTKLIKLKQENKIFSQFLPSPQELDISQKEKKFVLRVNILIQAYDHSSRQAILMKYIIRSKFSRSLKSKIRSLRILQKIQKIKESVKVDFGKIYHNIGLKRGEQVSQFIQDLRTCKKMGFKNLSNNISQNKGINLGKKNDMDDYVKDQILKFFSFYFKNIEKSGYKVYQKNELEIRFQDQLPSQNSQNYISLVCPLKNQQTDIPNLSNLEILQKYSKLYQQIKSYKNNVFRCYTRIIGFLLYNQLGYSTQFSLQRFIKSSLPIFLNRCIPAKLNELKLDNGGTIKVKKFVKNWCKKIESFYTQMKRYKKGQNNVQQQEFEVKRVKISKALKKIYKSDKLKHLIKKDVNKGLQMIRRLVKKLNDNYQNKLIANYNLHKQKL